MPKMTIFTDDVTFITINREREPAGQYNRGMTFSQPQLEEFLDLLRVELNRLMIQSGAPLDRIRVESPFGDAKAADIEKHTWTVNRLLTGFVDIDDHQWVWVGSHPGIDEATADKLWLVFQQNRPFKIHDWIWRVILRQPV